MTKETRQAEFETRARDAEKTAATVRDPRTRDQWLKIAENYRQLAKTT